MIDNKKLTLACDHLFETAEGKKISEQILKAIDSYSMKKMISSGTLVGFSGGADSVLLLIFLWKMQKQEGFQLEAVHVNHMIRGDEADRGDKVADGKRKDALAPRGASLHGASEA